MRTLLALLLATSLASLDGSGAMDSPRRVEIDKTRQTLRAFEGDRLVLESRVSTGRRDHWTPNGRYEVGVKQRMHFSTRYHHAPMPFSVQVNGNIFIHGFTTVPPWPASHGCIRLPMGVDNPARRFFEWVQPGTPVVIFGRWTGGPPAEQGRNAAGQRRRGAGSRKSGN